MTSALIEFRVGAKECKPRYRRVQGIGLIPAVFAVMLIFSVPGGPGPGLFAALGIAIGLQLILWGSYGIHFVHENQSKWGRRLSETSDQWFPGLLFGMEHVFIALTLTMLWLCLADLGYPDTLLLHILFFALLPMLPLKTFAHRQLISEHTPGNEMLDSVTRYVTIIIATLFAAVSGHHFMFPPDDIITGDLPLQALIVWVPATIIIIICLISFAHQIRPAAQPVQDEEERPDY